MPATFQVNEAEHSVVHHIEVDRVPNSVGAERKRFARLPESFDPQGRSTFAAGVEEWMIVWERVGE